MQRLLLIRHGETDWNRDGRWQGWLDRPLTDLGESQAHDRGRHLTTLELEPVELHSSDLGRAVQTASIIGSHLGVEVTPHEGLRERHGGVLEGLDRAEIDARHPGVLGAWRRGGIDAPPGGETDDEVFARVVGRLGTIMDTIPEATTPVVVTHGGVMRILSDRNGSRGAPTLNLGGRWFTWDGTTPDLAESLPSLPEVA